MQTSKRTCLQAVDGSNNHAQCLIEYAYLYCPSCIIPKEHLQQSLNKLIEIRIPLTEFTSDNIQIKNREIWGGSLINNASENTYPYLYTDDSDAVCILFHNNIISLVNGSKVDVLLSFNQNEVENDSFFEEENGMQTNTIGNYYPSFFSFNKRNENPLEDILLKQNSRSLIGLSAVFEVQPPLNTYSSALRLEYHQFACSFTHVHVFFK